LDHVWLSATLVFAFLGGTLPKADNMDYWWTVKLGEGLLATRQLPTHDWLTFTATHTPYVEQQWLAQVVFAALYHWVGLEGTLVVRGLLLAGMSAGLFVASRRLGASAAMAAVACQLALPLIAGGAAMRPQLLALPLFTLVLLGTTIWRGRAWTLVALPLGMAVWANLHGSFPLGLVLVGLAVAGRAWEVGLVGWRDDRLLRRLLLLLALCAPAWLVTPYGLGLVAWLGDYLTFTNGAQGLPALNSEWQATSWTELYGKLFILSAFVLVITLVRVGPPGPADSLRLLVFAALALQAVRSTVWWGLVMAPVLAWGLSGLRRSGPAAAVPGPRQRLGWPAANAALIAGLLVLAGLSLPWLRPLNPIYTPERFPVADPEVPAAAADYAATLSATRLYNDYNWNGYLAWRLAPQQQLFVRMWFYPAQFWRDYFAIARAQPGWADLLRQYEVDGLVLSRKDEAPLLAAMEADGSWRAVYCDATSAVYLPRATAGDRTVPCGPADTSTAGRPS
jgi:hypothetical protein